ASEAPASGILTPGTRLAQITYDATGAMINQGEVELPGRLLRVFDTGGYTVVTTPSEVVIVAPACL
ncbi:MAG: hypothetical protein V3T05_10065, partial [Myxococcota bacterium]